ncbi:hypothetical protein HZS_2460 [Henneguya salminicola]|nr:hypothetical protein HZS_2460 [Henneguya salminicola]
MNATHTTQRYPSYLVMVIKAILSSNEKRLLLQEIYTYIKKNYGHVISNHVSWQNSIRHNLSNHGCFYKIRNLNHGASYWGIYSQYIPFFEKGDFSRRWATGPKRRQQSQPLYGMNFQDNSIQSYPRTDSYQTPDYYNSILQRNEPFHNTLFNYYVPTTTTSESYNCDYPSVMLGIPPIDISNSNISLFVIL